MNGFDVKWLLKMALWLYFLNCVILQRGRIQFIGKRLEGLRAKMQGWEKAYGGLRLNERRAHGLCFFIANQGVTHVIGSLVRARGVEGSTKEAQSS